jgi:hypothetical protein
MSEIIKTITSMIEVIADNPASILIVLGFISILLAVFIPIGFGAQLLLGGGGVAMIIVGVILNLLWLES